MVTSTWSIRPPALLDQARAHARGTATRRRRAIAGRDGGKWSPMSPAPIAPSRASVSAWSDDVGVAVARRGPVVRDPDAAEPERRRPGRRRGRRSRSRCAASRGGEQRLGAARNPPRRSASRAPDRPRRSRPSSPAARATCASSVASPPGQAAWARRIAVEAEGLRGLDPDQAVARRRSRRACRGRAPACRRPGRTGTAPSCVVERVEQPVDHRRRTGRGGRHRGSAPARRRRRRAPRARSRTDCRRVAPPMIGAGRARSPTASR